MTVIDNDMQTRDVPGAQVRRQSRDMDVVRIIREARLPGTQRKEVVEYVNRAHVHDTRSELGGAAYLQRVAAQMPERALPGARTSLRQTMRRLSTAFVHPKGSR
jgi:hypothetical protein